MGAFVKRLYAERLKEEPGEGFEPLVLFTAGGSGAAKTTGLELSVGVHVLRLLEPLDHGAMLVILG